MIHRTAIVEEGARLAPDVSVGPYTTIHAGVEVGGGSIIDGFCILGYPGPAGTGAPLTLGAGARIRSHSVVYAGSSFGPGLVTGHRVTVREGTVAGEALQIGTLSDLQGDCVIGNQVRTHSNVFIGKGSWVGDFVWIFPYVVLTNDPHPPSEVRRGVKVEPYAVIATMSVILPGVTVGAHSVVGASSLVNRDVEPGMLVAGNPAQPIRPASEIRLRDGHGEPAYPWPRHFHRGYPPEVVDEWRRLFG